jgi:hypothetical protein
MEKAIKEKRFLVLSSTIFGIGIFFSIKGLFEGLNSETGFNTHYLMKTFPFFMVAISMAIYSIGLYKKIRKLD